MCVRRVPVGEAVGRVSAELLCPYPPGVPVLVAAGAALVGLRRPA